MMNQKKYRQEIRKSYVRKIWIVSTIALVLILMLIAMGEAQFAIVPAIVAAWMLWDAPFHDEHVS